MINSRVIPKQRAQPRINVLGVGISSINMAQAVATIGNWIQERQRAHYVCVTGVHGVMEAQKDGEIKQIHNQADLVTPDGMPLVWLNHFFGQHHVGRVYGPDLMLVVCQRSLTGGYRHFLYGGADGVAEKLATNLQQRYTGLQIVGSYSPPFRPMTPAEDNAIVTQINESGADIVWVGLSTPKQERWMAAHVKQIKAPVLIGVGAAFDFHAGLKPQAPRWMQQSGLEWCFRLLSEPRRLGPRYLVNNPRFLWLLLLSSLRLRQFQLENVEQV